MTIEKHRCMIPLESDKILRRYIDINKFKDLFETNSLFFCRADKFSDPFEGSLPKKEYDFRIKQGFDDGFKEMHVKMKKYTLINCWHISDYESDAMWRLYLKSNEGVAIQTTVGKLCDTLEKSNFPFRTSKVRYIDYDNDSYFHETDYPELGYNFIIPLIHKRIEFEHEREFRILFDIEYDLQSDDFWDNEQYSTGKKIEINLSGLIDKIILPPTSDSCVKDKIENMIRKFGYTFEICKSKLSGAIYY